MHVEKRRNGRATDVRLMCTINHGILDHDTIVFASDMEQFVRFAKEELNNIIEHIDNEEVRNRIVGGQFIIKTMAVEMTGFYTTHLSSHVDL